MNNSKSIKNYIIRLSQKDTNIKKLSLNNFFQFFRFSKVENELKKKSKKNLLAIKLFFIQTR